MNIKTPGTNRSSGYRGGTYRDRQWYCLCNKEAKYLVTRQGPNEGQAFYKCGQEACKFWLWEEHETEARRQLANALSPEPQTPSRSRQVVVDSRIQSTPPTGSQSSALRYSNTPVSDRVLRSARQATPSSSQINRHFPSPQITDDDDELATRVTSLLEGFNITLNPKQKRKLQVLIDDYIEAMRNGHSEDDDGYIIN